MTSTTTFEPTGNTRDRRFGAFPLSPAQTGLWYAQKLAPEVPLTVAQYVDVAGPLDADLVGEVAATVGAELQSGCIRVVEVDGRPHQVVDTESVHTRRLDLRGEADPVAAAHRWMRQEMHTPVDVERDALTVNVLLRVGDERWFWYTRMHHLAGDGFGAVTALRRVAELYTARAHGTDVAPHRAHDLAELYRAEETYRQSPRFATDREYWAAKTAGLPERFSLVPRSAPAAATRRRVDGIAPTSVTEAIAAVAARVDGTEAAVLVAAIAAYLHRVTGSVEVVLSLPVSVRTTAALRRSGGMFSNVVPLRLRVEPHTTLDELIAAVTLEITGALRHQKYRHEDIRRDHGSGTDQRGFFGPMVNIMLFDWSVRLGDLTGRLHNLSSGPVEDLAFTIYNSSTPGAGLNIDLEANPALYDDDVLGAHHRRFLAFLGALLTRPEDAPVTDAPVFLPDELETVVETFNDTATDVAPDTLWDAVARRVAATPDAPALTFGTTTLTYAETADRAGRVAAALRRRGVVPGDLVALSMPRSLELVLGMYGILHAGAAYLPLDPEQPAERIAAVLDTARPRCVLTRDDVVAAVADAGDPVAPVPTHPDDLAYVLFTSGSTGEPKGVAVTHRAITNRLEWMQHEYPLAADDVVLQKTPATFDVSVWEFFWPLRVGARLVIAEPGVHREPRRLLAAMTDAAVTTVHFVPSMLAAFVTEMRDSRVTPTHLRRVFSSGEALPADTAAAFTDLTAVPLHNLYGPTEAAVDVTYRRFRAGDVGTVPIGRPVWNTRVHVLDARLRPVPVGVAGELYLAGVQLARGYLGRPDLTADRFVADPIARDGTRLYRTGDLARWRGDGDLDYLGRTDFQVKVRGLRIELGDVEAALLAHPGVDHAVAVAHTDGRGETRLVGYVAGPHADSIAPDDVRTTAAARVPAYMVPDVVTVLPALPLGSSGKVDRRALPEPTPPSIADDVAPRTDLERRIAAVLADVLEIPAPGVHTSFFDLGGTSLSATRVVARLSTELDRHVGLDDLFTAPTVARLADRLSAVDAPADRPPLVPVERPDLVPLSPAQQRLWFLNRLDPASPVYNMPLTLEMTGTLDRAALRDALADVVARHESLRTVFPDGPHGPHQVIEDPRPQDLEPIEVTESALREHLAVLVGQGFDVRRDHPIRARLYRVDVDRHVLAVVLHHIVADGWSFGPLATDVARAYAARAAGRAPEFAPLPVQYADAVLWQRAVLGDPSDPDSLLAAQTAFWTERLAGLPEVLDLPTDRPRRADPGVAGAVHTFTVDADLRAAVTALASAHSASAFMVVHAALSTLLGRLADTDDVAVGTPVAGRGDRALDGVVGMFVNTLVLRSAPTPDRPFVELLRSVRDDDLEAFARADVPFDTVVDAVAADRTSAHHPLFQVMLSFDNLAPATVTLPGLTVTASDVDTGTAKFDLTVEIVDRPGGGYDARLGYATELFDAATAADLAARFVAVLRQVTADPEVRVGDVDLTLATDPAPATDPVLVGPPGGAPTTLPDLLRATAARFPDRDAVVDADRTLTYRELDDRSDRLAAALVDLGVGPEVRVPVCVGRSAASLIALWAVAKSGGAYTPLDPKYPADRLASMVADTGAAVGLAGDERTMLPDGVRWLDPRVDRAPVRDARTAEHMPSPHPDQAAYLIFTSGSTGRPKAVVVSHRGIADLAADTAAAARLDETVRALHFASPSFDVSLMELLMAFAVGGAVVPVPLDVYGGRELAALLRDRRVTHAVVTPAALETVDPTTVPDLRVAAVGGDVCTPALVERWAPGRTMLNVYGPTEATVVVTRTAPMTPGEPVTIGRARAGVVTRVLDRRLRPVAPGVRGELYLCGPSLARGYQGRPGLTAERFVADPDGPPGSRMYRTGDVVALRTNTGLTADPDSRAIHFLGRADHQVKVRGHRVELAEVDAVLQTHPAVTWSVTLLVDADRRDVARLVTYAVTDAPDHDALTADLLDIARRALPDYMVPASIVRLDALPLTPSGKLDRRALPVPAPPESDVPHEPPATETERIVAAAVADAVGLDRVGRHDHFFHVGGNSLTATRVAGALSDALGRDVAVRTVFEDPTVAALAARLDSAAGPARLPLVAVPIDERPDRVPLSPAQQRLWFLNRLDPESDAYTIALSVTVDGPLDRDALRHAMLDVLDRHEALRTVYPATDDGPHQVVRAVTDPLEVRDVDADSVQDALLELAHRGTDLTTTTPVRAVLLRVSDTHHVLGVAVHHIAADGWSMRPLTRDLVAAYAARTDGLAPDLPPLPVQYTDVTLWQRRVLGDEADPTSRAAADLAFWTETLRGAPDECTVPGDRPRPALPGLRAGTREFAVPTETMAGLTDVAARRGATRFMALHAVLASVLGRLADTTDVVVGTPVAGRHDPAMHELVGMFVGTVALRTAIDPADSFLRTVDRVRETDLDALAHTELPFERVVDAVAPSRAAGRHPLVQVVLTVDEPVDTTVSAAGLTWSAAPIELDRNKFDLDVAVLGTPRGWTLRITYSRDLYDAATIDRLGERLLAVADAAAADPDRPLGDAPLLAAEERARLAEDAGSADEVAPPALLPDLWATAVRRGRDRLAAIGTAGEQVTYDELDRRADRLARHLFACGAGPEDVVAVALPRSLAAVTAVLAVAKTGAAWVPVDPRYPADRVRHMLTDSGARLGITTTEHRPDADVADVTWVDAEDVPVDAIDRPVTDADRRTPLRADHVAYVIYTSGSTGVPKGVSVTHSGLSAFADAERARFAVDDDARVLHVASPSFDASVLELLMAVGSAATLVIAPPDVFGGRELARLLRRERVSHAFVTPAALATVDPADGDGLPDLRTVVVGGEAVGADLVRRWAPGRSMVNGYGPTETTVVATTDVVRAESLVTVGTPIPGTRAAVLDGRLHPVPRGTTGELYLAGRGVARGYLRRAGLTAGRFVADPTRTGERMYRTGDLVRWTADGRLEYVGRTDTQVKLRGFRIEPGEIDAVLTARDDVSFAHTAVHVDESGTPALASWVVPTAGASVDTDAVLADLARTLPAHLVPATVTVMDAVPLTPVGKLDARALPAPVRTAHPHRPVELPATPGEQLVADVLAGVLGDGIGPIGRDDDFFALGGNSLLATQVVARLGTRTGTTVPVRVLFEHPTVRALATRVATLAADDTPALGSIPRPDRLPLSASQARQWFLNRVDPTSPLYNVPVVVRLTGALDVDALRAALTDVTARHEVLRTVYPDSASGPHQVVLPVERAEVPLTTIDVTENRVRSAALAAAGTGFDVTVDAPLRATLLRLDPAAHVLVLVLHHIAADGWSLGPLAADLAAAYDARTAGHPPEWTPLPIQYVDHTLWTDARLGDESDPTSLLATQLAWWTETLDGAPDTLGIPTDRPRPATPSYRGGTVVARVDDDLHRRLHAAAAAEGATLFMAVHAALAVTLGRLDGRYDTVVGTALAGRGHEALDRLVGMFVGTLPLRTRIDPRSSMQEALRAVRAVDVEAFARPDVPFERLVEAVAPTRSAARHPIFQVMLTVRDDVPGRARMGTGAAAVEAEVADLDVAVAKFDLQLTVTEHRAEDGTPAGLTMALDHAVDLFDETTARTLLTRLDAVLRTLATRPTTAVGAIDLLTPEERGALVPVGGPRPDAPRTLAAVLDDAVRRSPDGVAAEHLGRSITYRELDDLTDRWARLLVARGARPDTLVAVGVPRSLDSLVAVLAVARSGAGFLPIDPAYPADRIRHMLTDARPTLGLTTAEHRAAVTVSGTDTEWLTLDDATLAAGPVAPGLLPRAGASHPAYVIYTSGSTGTPKGVVVTHAGVSNFAAELADRLEVTGSSRVLHFASISFDAAVLDLLFALGAGATLVIAPTTIVGGRELAEFLGRERVTHAFVTPAALTTADPAAATDLTHLVVGGDACSPDLVARWAPGRKFHNAYGPTETTVVTVMTDPLEAGAPITIGSPVRGVAAVVLDRQFEPVPYGVVGELHLTGDALARGYLGRSGLTASRFVAAPHGKPGERMYRTGDLVRWRRGDSGPVLTYVGRSDHQVKVRGFRVELGEIDAALETHDDVEFAVTLGVSDDDGATVGPTSLASYVLVRSGAATDGPALRRFLSQRMPSYLVPTSVTLLDSVPLTPTGKLDRRALPAPAPLAEHTYRAPTTETEALICTVFAEVLAVDRVGLDDDFFAIGGTSLVGVRAVADLGARLGRTVPVSLLFGASTPAELAIALDAPTAGTDDPLAPVVTLRAGSTSEPPLVCVHPAFGLAWSYHGLARRLGGDRTVLGLQTPTLTGDRPEFASIEEMASDYVDRLVAVQPDGPYHLLGWSLGGLIAHAMTAELERRGNRVATLAMLDSYTLTAEYLDRVPTLRDLIEEVTGTPLPEGLDPTPGDAADLARAAGDGAAALTADVVERLYRGYVHGTTLAHRYRPVPVDADVLFFSATADEVNAHDTRRRAAAWTPFVRGTVRDHAVPYAHAHLTADRALDVVVPVLDEHLGPRHR
ncbi:non-ribosomal peptide synthetase [Rhodococcoides corynebacterioides]|uniref:Amino acid adenylation domain-containing protein n=1 Tax=Rhodococcoides corynebacterioides TaxID=53972 RepID=A0ABS7P2H3_9NOCA|nr:non-ribosomal peptide synthetase [Rhodococcus corynebacterioides]MBY6366097.1 amino acid adenylation domain-containing protein [Rhodococcus corynebacterioides]MBY6406945.1 amino acid adenylation domain-containing protein [Rhodococcus corynebacterioides]